MKGGSIEMVRLGVGWLLVTVLALSLWTLVASAQPVKSVEFKKGQFEFKQAEKVYKVPLLQSAGASSLDVYKTGGKEVLVVGLVYQNPDAQVRMALQNVAGPGKYGNAVIFNFVVQTVGFGGSAWNFSRRSHNCTFTFRRLDASGIEGSAACTATSGERVPWSGAKFSARP